MWVLSNDNRLSKSLVPKVSANIQKASAKPCPKQVSVVPSENDNLNNPSEFIITPINFFKLCEQSTRMPGKVKGANRKQSASSGETMGVAGNEVTAGNKGKMMP